MNTSANASKRRARVRSARGILAVGLSVQGGFLALALGQGDPVSGYPPTWILLLAFSAGDWLFVFLAISFALLVGSSVDDEGIYAVRIPLASILPGRGLGVIRASEIDRAIILERSGGSVLEIWEKSGRRAGFNIWIVEDDYRKAVAWLTENGIEILDEGRRAKDV